MRIDIKKTARALSACEGKLKHKSRADAEKHARNVRHRRSVAVRAYLCLECDLWHIGGWK